MNIYDVVLKQRSYKPITGYYGEPKYWIVFYDEDKEKAISEMAKYVKKNGFVTPDGNFTVEGVGLRERTPTGGFIKYIPYHEIFNPTTGQRI